MEYRNSSAKADEIMCTEKEIIDKIEEPKPTSIKEFYALYVLKKLGLFKFLCVFTVFYLELVTMPQNCFIK